MRQGRSSSHYAKALLNWLAFIKRRFLKVVILLQASRRYAFCEHKIPRNHPPFSLQKHLIESKNEGAHSTGRKRQAHSSVLFPKKRWENRCAVISANSLTVLVVFFRQNMTSMFKNVHFTSDGSYDITWQPSFPLPVRMLQSCGLSSMYFYSLKSIRKLKFDVFHKAR